MAASYRDPRTPSPAAASAGIGICDAGRIGEDSDRTALPAAPDDAYRWPFDRQPGIVDPPPVAQDP